MGMDDNPEDTSNNYPMFCWILLKKKKRFAINYFGRP